VSRLKPGTIGVREQGKIDKERRIKAAAQGEFRENGYLGATMRSIAARAGVATGTLFLYAPDKPNLLLWILNEDLDALTDQTFSQIPAKARLLDQLVVLFTPRYRYWSADPELASHALGEVMLMRTDAGTPDSQIAHYHRRRGSLITRIAELITEHQQRGDVRTGEAPETIAALVMAIYLAAVRIWLREAVPEVDAGIERLTVLLRVALNGVLTTPEPKR
jgi:AcrR family transcriptional regulator